MQGYEKLIDGFFLALAGLCGAFMALVNSAETRTFKQRVSFITCGAVSAYYCAVPLAKWLGITDTDYVTVFGFGIGLFGAAIVQSISRRLANTDILGAILGKFGL